MKEGRKETIEEIIWAMQGIFCKWRYSPLVLLHEELRKEKKRRKILRRKAKKDKPK
jgi:hypothetical protein